MGVTSGGEKERKGVGDDEKEGGSGRGENRFPFSRARLPLAQRCLISSPRQTAQWLFFFSSFRTLLLSTCSTLSTHRMSTMFYFVAEISIVVQVFYEPVAFFSPVSAAPPPVSRILAETRFRPFLITLIIFVTLFRIFAICIHVRKSSNLKAGNEVRNSLRMQFTLKNMPLL